MRVYLVASSAGVSAGVSAFPACDPLAVVKRLGFAAGGSGGAFTEAASKKWLRVFKRGLLMGKLIVLGAASPTLADINFGAPALANAAPKPDANGTTFIPNCTCCTFGFKSNSSPFAAIGADSGSIACSLSCGTNYTPSKWKIEIWKRESSISLARCQWHPRILNV